MSATVIQFPARRYRHVRIERQAGDLVGWFVISGEHGWLHPDWHSAFRDARELAANLGVAIRSSAGRVTR